MSSQARVQALFQEPACDKNQAKDANARKKGCSKPLTPGAAAGGCAFDGAKIVLQPVTDVAHLIHGPLACEGNSWDNRGAASSGPGLWRMSFTTDLTELDVVMGQGEKKLFKAIREIIEQHSPPAVFVYSTCVTALIGDDLDAVCFRASERFGTPVVPVHAPGFVGSKNLGNKLAGEALLDHVIGSHEPDDVGPMDINILGEFNLSGEFWMVKPLLEMLGMRVRACVPGDARYLDIAGAHTARVNMMVCSTALINLARKMEERWGIPYFEGSFYGVSDTSDALRQLARLLVQEGAERDLIDRTEILIAEEEARAWTRLEVLSEAAFGQARAAQHRRRQVVVGGGGAAGDRHRDRRHVDQEIDRRGQGAHQGAAQGREARLRRHGAAGPLRDARRRQGRHHAVRRPDPVHRFESQDALARHQSGAPSSLRGL